MLLDMILSKLIQVLLEHLVAITEITLKVLPKQTIMLHSCYLYR